MNFNGVEIRTNMWLTEDGEPRQVRRSWRSRLFSRPWRPWRATFTEIPQVPSKRLIQLTATRWMCHPAMLEELKRQLDRPASPVLPVVEKP